MAQQPVPEARQLSRDEVRHLIVAGAMPADTALLKPVLATVAADGTITPVSFSTHQLAARDAKRRRDIAASMARRKARAAEAVAKKAAKDAAKEQARFARAWKRLFKLANRERAREGLPPLVDTGAPSRSL